MLRHNTNTAVGCASFQLHAASLCIAVLLSFDIDDRWIDDTGFQCSALLSLRFHLDDIIIFRLYSAELIFIIFAAVGHFPAMATLPAPLAKFPSLIVRLLLAIFTLLLAD